MTETARYGQWLSQKRMGEGSFAMVFKGCNLQNTKQFAAVKVLRDEWCTRKMFRERFAEEAQTMEILGAGAVRIPSLAAYYGSDTEAAKPWIAIEYIDGKPLDEVVVEGKMPDGTLVPRGTKERAAFGGQVIRDVCEALAFAHRRGIVHRDVKPENILVGKDGRYVIIDFGIARDARGKRHTGEDVPSPMTPDYAAPELLESRVSEHLEPALDVYALGCTLYEVLTGDLPTVSQTNEGSGVRYMPRAQPLELPESWPNHLRVLVRAMTLVDAMSRPSLAQIIATLDTGHIPVNLMQTGTARVQGPPPPTQPGPYAAMPMPAPGAGQYPHATGGYRPPSGAYPSAPGYPAPYGSGAAPPHYGQRQAPQPAHLRSSAPQAPLPSAMQGMEQPPPHASGELKAQVTGNLPPPKKPSRPVGPSMGTLLGGALVVVLGIGGAVLAMSGGGSGEASEDDLIVERGLTDGGTPAAPVLADAPAPTSDKPSTQATLQIETRPPGAVAKIAGTILGTTPTQASLGPGAYVLSLEHPDHRKVFRLVGASDGKVSVDIAREARRSQLLIVDPNVEGAIIRVDGKDVGRAPGVFEVQPGERIVQAFVRGVPRTKKIMVKAAATKAVKFD